MRFRIEVARHRDVATEGHAAQEFAWSLLSEVARVRMGAVVGWRHTSAGREFTASWDVEVGLGVVVAREGQNASAHLRSLACAVVVGGLRVVVLSLRIGTSRNLKLVTHPIAVGVVRAVAVAVQELTRRVGAQREVGHQGLRVKVACIHIHATHARTELTRPSEKVICFGIEVAGRSHGASTHQASSVIVCGVRIEVGRVAIGATQHFEFITHAVTICVIEAVAIAVVGEVGQVTQAIVDGRFSVVVARLWVGAACAAREVTRTLDLVVGLRVVVARIGERTSTHKTRTVVKCRIGVVVGVGGIRATLLICVTDVVLVHVFQAVTTTHANGVVLVAVTVAVALRDVRTSALVDGTRASADAARIEFGT